MRMIDSYREGGAAYRFIKHDNSIDYIAGFGNPYTASLACEFVRLAAKCLGSCVNDGYVVIMDETKDQRAYYLQFWLYEVAEVIISHTTQGFSCHLCYDGEHGRKVALYSVITIWPDEKVKAMLRFVRRDVKRRFPSELFPVLRKSPINSLKVGKPRLLAPLEMPPTMAEQAETFRTAIQRNFPHAISSWITWNIIEGGGPHSGFCCTCVYANFLPIGFSFEPYSFYASITYGYDTRICGLSCVCDICDYEGRIDIIDWDDFCRQIKARLDAFIPIKYLKVWQRIGTDYSNEIPGAAMALDAPIPDAPDAPAPDAFLAMLAAGMGPRGSGFETLVHKSLPIFS